jgi:histone-lysine N-methyltransferase SETD2
MPGFTQDKSDPQRQEKWKDFYDSWHEIVASMTEAIYNERLQKFKERYISDHVDEVGYIMQSWLDLYKKRFVKAWVSQYLHFEQFVTSRVEGIHQLIKTPLNTSQTDPFEAWRAIKRVLLNQHSELQANQAYHHSKTPLYISGVLYSNIRG